MISVGTRKADHERHVRSEYRFPSPAPSTRSASQSLSPGIPVFSQTRRLLHMNRRALELTGHLNQAEIGPVNDVRSAPVRELSAQIQEALDSRREANIWELFELKRFIFEAGRRILVRGFGLADRNSHDDSRIIIVLEEVSLRQEYKARQAPAQGPPSESPRRRLGAGTLAIQRRDIRRAREWRAPGE